MLKNRSLKLFLVSILALVLAACALPQKIDDPFAYTAYQSLVSSMASYRIIANGFISLRAQRQVSDDAWDKFLSMANDFIDEHQKASVDMAKYKRGTIGENAAKKAIKIMEEALGKLIEHYENKIPADQREPLIK